MVAQVSQLCIYPIKSTAALTLKSSQVEEHGLAFDRRFIVATLTGEMITGRTHAKLPLVNAELNQQGMLLSAEGMPNLAITQAKFSDKYNTVSVWKNDIQAQHCHPDYDRWFSEYLGQDCQLLFFGEQSERRVKRRETQVAFADAYPLLLISQASLDKLNLRCPKPQTMSQFRPNIVVKGTDAFAEDSWKRIRIGDVEFEITTPCSRCVFTTLDTQTQTFDPDSEPLKSLSQFRKGVDGNLYFGQNMVALNSGVIKQGDEVEILERQSPTCYTDSLTAAPASTELTAEQAAAYAKERFTEQAPADITILFDSWDTPHQGNNQQSILDQAKQASVPINYSCRRGFCGCCKVKLQTGDVEPLTQSGLSEEEQQQGYILACRCRPLSDITLTQD